jgi:1-phosphofructokinase family hexose kinase
MHRRRPGCSQPDELVITVIGFSPAVDTTYTVPKLVPGSTHKVQTITSIPGGKSVNVASVLKKLNTPSQVVIPLGGSSGSFIEQGLRANGVTLVALKTSSDTRTCVAVVDESATVFNEPATELTESEYEQFENLVYETSKDSEVVVFSGSMPANYSPDRFGNLLRRVKTDRNFLIVDTSGAYLIEAANAQADLLKPNSEELQAVFPEQSLDQALETLIEAGAAAVYLSMGSKGGRYQNSAENLGVEVPEVSGNATGAGDAFVAGFASAKLDGLNLTETLTFASACGSAAVLEKTGGVVSTEQIAFLRPRVKVVPL